MFYSLLRSILPMCQCHWYCCVLVSGLEAADVRSVVDLGFSLHVINMSQCVDALIWGNDVAVMLATIKGHLKVIVYQGENISLNHLTVLISVCLSVYSSIRPPIRLFVSLLLVDNVPDHMRQHYVSVFAWQHGYRGKVIATHPSPIFQSSIHYAFVEGLSRWTISEALRNKRKNNLCSPREKWRSLLSVNGNLGLEWQLRLLPTPGWPQWYSSLWQTTEAHVRNKVILCHTIVSSSVVSCITHEMATYWILALLWWRVKPIHYIFFL